MDAQALSDSLSSAVEAAAPSVVRVEGRCALASGIAWSSEGVFVTAWHAIARCEELTVTLADGRSAKATLVAHHAGSDVAVLRADLSGVAVPTWDDGEGVKVGHLALPLGRPGRTARAALGLIAAVGEGFRAPTGHRFERYFEVDGSLPRGFSGGPLIDARGRVLGMNTAAVMRGGMTVPTVTLRKVVTRLLERGKSGHGYLGVSVYPTRLPEAIAQQTGSARAVVVVGVEPEGPAARGGILVGDVIVSIDGEAIEGPADLMGSLDGLGDSVVKLRLVRGGELRELSVTAGSRG